MSEEKRSLASRLLIHTKVGRVAAAAVVVAALSLGGGFLGARFASSGNPIVIQEVGLNNQIETSGSTAITAAAISSDGLNDQAVSRSFQEQFRQVARSTLPVVAELNVVTTVTQQMPANPFEFFFGPQSGSGQEKPRQRQFQQRGLGSGVLVGKDRNKVYVLTNNHVVGEADQIEVVLYDNRTFTGSLVGTDSLMDLALVSFEVPDGVSTDDIPIATLGDSDALEIGDWVFAVGNPLGFQSTVTAGIVSAMERNAQPGSGMSGITSYIQTDAAINRGNSGGALVNLDGQVVGINTWIASQTGGSIGLGFAIPANMARRAIRDFIATGEVSYSWLGVTVGHVDDTTASELGISDSDGAFVYGVFLDSPAGAAGIHAGDLITQIGDVAIADANALIRAVATLPPNERIPAVVIRDGKEQTISVRTSARSNDTGSDAALLWPGVSVISLTSDVRDELSVKNGVQGVVVGSVASGTSAEGSGIRQGDIITAVNGEQVSSVSDFYRLLGTTSQDEIQFRIDRDGTTLILGFVKPKA